MPCIYCGSNTLVQDPLRPHWRHCTNCNPEQARYAQNTQRLLTLDTQASSWSQDMRGAPKTRNTQGVE